MTDSDEVSIVGVDIDTDCVCLSGTKKTKATDCIRVKGKGKEPANPNKPIVRKRNFTENDDVIILAVTKQQKPDCKPDCAVFDCIPPPPSVSTDAPSSSISTDGVPCKQPGPTSAQSAVPGQPSGQADIVSVDEVYARQLQTQELASADSATLQQIQSDEQLAKQLLYDDVHNTGAAPSGLSILTSGHNTFTDLSGQSLGVNGQSFGVRGQSSGVSGQSSDLSGQSFGISGQSSGVSGQSSGVSGQTDASAPSDPSGSGVSTHGRPLGPERFPNCWITCPKCLPTDKRRYHLIDVTPGSSEWHFVSESLVKANYNVHRVQRIQNELLWQRLMLEKNLMLREREDVNIQLLYHTTRAKASVICEEGLDLRLSRNGRFGNGIYFSDDPTKCNNYWSHSSGHGSRQMFVCRVLLGDIKEYQENQCDHSLVREPLKKFPKPGEPKSYDSVKGRICGQNEYVVYNAYRVMPEYLLEYTVGAYTGSTGTAVGHSLASAVMASAMSYSGAAGSHTNSSGVPWALIPRQQKKRGRKRKKS